MEVSEIAAFNAAAFDAEANARACGIFHDVGKNGPLFLKVLSGEAVHVNHSAPGVIAFLLALRRHGHKSFEEFYPILACIAWHHGGLQNGISFVTRQIIDDLMHARTMDGKGRTYALTGEPQITNAIAQLSGQGIDINLQNCLPVAECFDTHCSQKTVAEMLYTRMLYSCLVDGDYCSAAGIHPAEARLDVDKALMALSRYRTRIQEQNRNGDPVINRLRDSVFEACSLAGQAPQKAATLTAPTGAGKTLALLEFALQQMKAQGRRRAIIVLPYLSIIDQNVSIYRQIVPELLEIHSQSLTQDITHSAGDYINRWEASVIVTTAVQFFETLFANSGPSLRKLHQFADSVIVFDEAQSLPAELGESTIQSMEALVNRYRCTILLSTATQPAFDIIPTVDWAPREIMSAPYTDEKTWASLLSKSNRVEVDWMLEEKLSFEELSKFLCSDYASNLTACAILNRRDHARKLYFMLRAQMPREALFFLSSELCPAHRKRVMAAVQRRLSKNLPCILVSTQCIEAGVDLSFQAMYRALAPLESVVQAAGRCKRHDTRGPKGRLVVFIPDVPDFDLYPVSAAYRQGANDTKRLWQYYSSLGQRLELGDQTAIRKYYTDFFLYADSAQPKQKLDRAIREKDYAAVAEEYKLIDNSGATIVIPHGTRFDKWEETVLKLGLTKRVMKAVSSYSITTYDRRLLSNCIPIPLRVKGKADPAIPSGWYFLKDKSAYDWNGTGLGRKQAP